MRRRPIARVRERMVLGQVRPLLEDDERVQVWAHVQATVGTQPGLLSLTAQRCLVHWTPRDEATAVIRWTELHSWELSTVSEDGAVLRMAAGTQEIEVLLPLTTGARARTATEVVDHVVRHAPTRSMPGDRAGSSPLPAAPRGWRAHLRRVIVTVVGLLVVLLSAVFASPFVPGPGALTFLAGLAILAREYDWARDVHHWVKRKFDRLRRWLRAQRDRRRERRRERRRARRGAEVRRFPEAPDVTNLESIPRARNE